MPDEDTEELVRRASHGDDAAVEELMQRFRPRLRSMVRARIDARIAARVDPSDVIQETLTTAYYQLPKYLKTQPIPFYPWLRRIAWEKLVHLREQHLDAQKRTVTKEEHFSWQLSDQSEMQLARAIAGSTTSPSAAIDRQELRGRVRAALDQLSEKDREVLLQRYVEQLSAKEIAAFFGTTEAAIHVRHMRALQKVQRLLKRNAE